MEGSEKSSQSKHVSPSRVEFSPLHVRGSLAITTYQHVISRLGLVHALMHPDLQNNAGSASFQATVEKWISVPPEVTSKERVLNSGVDDVGFHDLEFLVRVIHVRFRMLVDDGVYLVWTEHQVQCTGLFRAAYPYDLLTGNSSGCIASHVTSGT